jgi:hypothetical protein
MLPNIKLEYTTKDVSQEYGGLRKYILKFSIHFPLEHTDKSVCNIFLSIAMPV